MVPLAIRGKQYYHHISSKETNSKSSTILLKEAEVLTFEPIYVDSIISLIFCHLFPLIGQAFGVDWWILAQP